MSQERPSQSSPLISNIVVGTDFSESAAYALDYAIQLATQLQAKLTVVHVYELPVYSMPDGAIMVTAEMAARVADAAQGQLDQLVQQKARQGVTVKGVLRQGTAWQEMDDVAKKERADLIVVGTHGRRGLSHMLLGSVAEKIVRTASCPVLTLRQPS